MSTPERNGNSPESLGSAPKSPVESVKNRLDQVAAKNGDPAFANVIGSLKSRIDGLPDGEKESVSKEIDLIITEAERTNQKIGVDFYRTVDLLLSGKIG